MPDYLYAHPYIDVRVRAGKRFAFADKIVVNMQQHRRFSWRAVPLGFLLNVEAAVQRPAGEWASLPARPKEERSVVKQPDFSGDSFHWF